MIRALGIISLIASFLFIGYTLGRNEMAKARAYPVADRWYHPADPNVTYNEEIKLVPRIVGLLKTDGRALHHLSIKAGLKLNPTVQPAEVWRACKMAEEMGYISQTEHGHFYLKEAP